MDPPTETFQNRAHNLKNDKFFMQIASDDCIDSFVKRKQSSFLLSTSNKMEKKPVVTVSELSVLYHFTQLLGLY